MCREGSYLTLVTGIVGSVHGRNYGREGRGGVPSYHASSI